MINTSLSNIPYFLLAILCWPFILAKRTKSTNRIIFFLQSKIGDLVSQLPLCRELKKKLPESFVTVVITHPPLKELIENDPNINEVIIWDEKSSRLKKIKLVFKIMMRNYDWSFNLSSQSWVDFIGVFALIPNRVSIPNIILDPISKLFYKISDTKLIKYEKGSYSTEVYLRMLRFIGIDSQDVSRQLFISGIDKAFVQDFIEKFKLKAKKYLIGINVSCANKLKQWPEERFSQLSDMILDTDKAVVIFTGSKEDKYISEKVISYMKHKDIFDFSGLFNLGQFAAFCEKLDLFISVDSGPLYIANAVGTPVIDIAGPFDIKEQLLLSSKSKVVQPDIPCIPCSFVMDTARSCKLGTRQCLMETEVEEVLKKVKEILPNI